MSGIAGIVDSRGVAYPLYYALHALQHRGQEAAGISTFDGHEFSVHKGPGQLSEVFCEEALSRLVGNVGVGQVLYTQIAHREHSQNTQPLNFTFKDHRLSITVSAALINRETLRSEYEDKGHIFSTTTNAELIAAMIAHELVSDASPQDAFVNTIKRLSGGYSGVAVLDGILYAFRDPLGTKPLCFGKTDFGYVVASESVALDILSAAFMGDVVPGELLTITGDGVSHCQVLESDHKAYCAFEYVYTARPDSVLDGVLVYDARRKIGACLAKNAPKADLVSPIPDSGTAFATGYASASGIPYIEGLLKNRYVGRTFIMPGRNLRENAVRMKMNPIRLHVSGKSVILVDDSIIRGTTSLRIVDMVKDFGAKEVHMRIGSPPIIAPCYFGVDFANRKELIATGRDTASIREMIHATTLEFVSHEDLVASIGIPAEDLCMACSSGIFPLDIPGECSNCPRRITQTKN
ncbi:MAG TPA: amidophosphoribosyltransferase [Methanocorpusculum sp.]|nr:amidophosphoribosyltransferase [Methanocorpusculum sp.]